MDTFITRRAMGSRAKTALLMLTVGAGLAAAMGTASAATADQDVPSVVLRYSSESLATDAGVKALYRRLVSASEKVCPETGRSPWVSDDVRACRREAVARAVAHVNNPHLAALYATSAKNG
jgi:UrcA family protein